jgi:hypothetical protein
MFLSLDVGETLAWLFGIPVCSVILVSLFWLVEVIYRKATGRKDREYIPSNKPCLADKTELYLIGYDYIGFIEKNDQKKWSPKLAQASPNKIRAGLVVLFSSILRHQEDWAMQRKTADDGQRIFFQVPFVIYEQSKFKAPLEASELQDKGNEAWDAFIDCILTKEKTAFVFDDEKIISGVLTKLPH